MPLEFLLPASQGCLIGLNFVEAAANFSQIAAGRSASELRSDEFEMAFNRGEVYLADGGVLPTSAGVLAGARR